jgi:WD40 repeat protein
MLVLGHPDAKIGNRQTAWIWALDNGNRHAVLDQMPHRVRGGWWSQNGKTLVTIDDDWSPLFTRKLGVSFWDGETFEYRTTISIENVTWLHLSDDGERFFAASGKKGNLLGIKYVKDTNASISMWRTSIGTLEKTIAVADASFTPKTREISVSPDDKFLLFVKKHKSNAAENRLLAWEMNGSVHPLYELKPLPRIDDSRIEFSRDGKYFALDVGKNLQIYETATGQKRSELINVELPNSWLSDDVLFRVEFKSTSLFARGKMLATFDASSGQALYKQRLQYDETNTHDYDGEVSGTETVDDTRIIPNPKKDLYVTQSNEYVELFSSRSGEHLQTVVRPPVVYDKNNKPKVKRGTLVKKAKWSKDGNTLFIFNSDHRTVSLWELVDN